MYANYGEPRSLDHETGKIRWIQTDAFCFDRQQAVGRGRGMEGSSVCSLRDLKAAEWRRRFLTIVLRLHRLGDLLQCAP